MRVHRTLTSIAVIAALIGLTGCGSDDKESSTSGDTGTSTTAPSEEPSDSEDSSTSDICTAVTDDEISGILGSPVTRQEVPGGGCNFTQNDPRAASVVLNTTPFDESNGGFDGAVSGVSAVLEGDAGEEVPGVGDEAFVKTGSMLSGSATNGAGVVHIGGIVVQVTLIQGEGLAAGKVKGLVVDTLKLIADKA